MKIAVTGAGGFVGARLIESFHLGEGPTLAAIAQHPSEFTSAARFAIDLRVADFLNVDSLARSFTGCSAVVHATRSAPADMKRATTVLCRAAAQAGVRRIVFLSSADVHGLRPPVGTEEKSTLHTNHSDELLNSMVIAERQFFTECRQLGLAGYALRAGFLYGPRSDAIASLAAALQGGRAWLVHRGKGICNSLYVDNLAAAVRVALKAKTGAGSAFLVTDAEAVTWHDFYHTAAQELNVAPSSIRHLDATSIAPGSAAEIPEATAVSTVQTPAPPTSPFLSADMIARQQCEWQLPTARATKELGYRPTVPVAEGMRRSCAWWRFAQGEFFAAA
jgi:nucleoside-diphosphate-sugar epimerase